MKAKSLLLTMVMASLAITGFAQTWNCGSPNEEDVTATLIDGTMTISGTGAMKDYNSNSSSPPWYGARTLINTLIIGDGITHIGGGAFCRYGYNFDPEYQVRYELSSVVIGIGVVTIGGSAFSECNKLTNVTIPDGAITSIGNSAFSGCSELNFVNIPNSVTTIGNTAFSGCSKFTSITIPAAVTTIGSGAFSDCEYLEAIYFNAENCTCTGSLFSGCYPQTVVIGNTVTRIPEYAFSRVGTFESITIPGSVTSIGRSAFSGCSSILSVSIPNSVTTIGSDAFRNCRELNSVTLPDNLTSISDYMFGGCSELSAIIIPAGVTSIGSYAFSDCKELESVTVQWAAPLSILESVFSGVNTNFVRLNVPEGKGSAYFGADVWKNFYIEGLSPYPGGSCGLDLTWTYDMNGTLAISGWGPMPDWYVYSYEATTPWYFLREKIHTVILPEGLTYIGDFAFRDISITSITIPESVTAIGREAFRNSELSSVTCLRPVPPIVHPDAFSQVNMENCNLYVLPESANRYYTADVWKEFNIKNYASINDINTQADIAIHINPDADFVTVTGLQSNEILYFYSVNGHLLFTHKATSETENIAVDHLPAGIYFVKTTGGKTVKWIKN